MSPKLDAILETALYAEDIAAAELFYQSVLGLEKIVRVDDRHVFFRCGRGVLLIFNPLATDKPPVSGALPVPPHGSHGPGHLCFAVAAPDFDGWISRLASAGIAIEADFTWPAGGRSIYFRDPAGNSLECAEARIWNFREFEDQHAPA